MTDQPNTDTPTLPVGGAESAPEQPQHSAEGDHQTDQAPQGDDTSAEAAAARESAKYRRQLRQVETERDSLLGRVQSMQRADVERAAAAAGLVKPAALWSAGIDVADLIDDDGNVDAGRVAEAIDTAIATLGLATRVQMKPDHSQGSRGAPAPVLNSWGEVLRRGDQQGLS